MQTPTSLRAVSIALKSLEVNSKSRVQLIFSQDRTKK